MRVPAMGLLWTAILVVSIVAIPVAAKVGLLILETSPNLRHPPADMPCEAVRWVVNGAVVGGAGAMIGDAMVMRDRRGTYRAYKGILVGSLVAVFAAGAFGAGLAVIQMDSIDGQAITSAGLGIVAGATVGTLGGVAGAVAGTIIKRCVERLIA